MIDTYNENTDNRYLTFTVSEIIYALHIKHVIEITDVNEISAFPGLPEYIVGLSNLRGKALTMLDLRVRLKKPKARHGPRTGCIVASVEGKDHYTLGLIVDKVDSIIEIKEEDVVPVPQEKFKEEAEFLLGIGKAEGKIQLLIDIERII